MWRLLIFGDLHSEMVLLWWPLLCPAKSYQGIACKARNIHVKGWRGDVAMSIQLQALFMKLRSCPYGKDHLCTHTIQVSNIDQPLLRPWPSHVGGFRYVPFSIILGTNPIDFVPVGNSGITLRIKRHLIFQINCSTIYIVMSHSYGSHGWFPYSKWCFP